MFRLFVDSRKAFDLVWRDVLWSRMFKLGIIGNIINVIRNMYSHIILCVSVNQELSHYFMTYWNKAGRQLVTIIIFVVRK